MNTETLRQIFQSPFNYPKFSREIVHDLFGCNDVYETLDSAERLNPTPDGDQNYFLGQMEDADKLLLGFFYTRVAKGSDVRRKRVGLWKLIQPYLKYEVEAAIAVFDDGQHWRLSYICDHKEGTTSAKRFSYVLGDKQGQYKTPLERLDRVAAKAGRFKLDDLKEAFSVDALSKEFFDEYHRHYDRICDYIIHSHINTLTQLHIHDYVKKMMGRIVFLHFLQKKGWLNDDPEFLSKLFFLSPYKQDFLEQELEPLFFGIFNTEPDKREQLFSQEHWDLRWLAEWEKLPYLNGGLFERDEVDKMKIKLPASLFENLFRFMASYNFTIDENDPDDADIGIDPEMLGKIFESLLEDNKAKGAFYTPKEIVRYMCKESLIAYLNSKVNSDEVNSESTGNHITNHDSLVTAVRQFVEQHEFPEELEPYREVLDTALRNVKICDPAIGSGAFPMGLLNELWRCREALEVIRSSPLERGTAKPGGMLQRPAPGTDEVGNRRAALKKEIIENNIYGVDIEKGAIDIARLRFWLSIVVDAEWNVNPDSGPEPLPNFDYKFMQGNSLIESFDGHDLSHILESSSRPLPGRGARRAGWAENQTGMEFGSDEVKQNLRNWLKIYFSLTDHKEKAYYRELINSSVKSYIKQQGIGPAAETRLNAIDPSANKHFFLWHTWFKDIFDNGGFDIVIGNPPYLESRSPDFQEELKDSLQKEISKNRSSEQKHFPRGADLLIYFFELSFRLLSRRGQSVLITENAWLSTDYGKLFQDFLINKCIINGIIDSDYKYFETADINTVITFIRNKDKRGMVVPIRFYHSHGNLKDYPCNTLSPRETENVSIKQFNSDDKFLASYKWGVIDKSDKRLINIMETLFDKENRLLSKKVSIGQGLNITKNNIVYHKTHNVVPYFTSEEGPKYVWTESNCFVNPNVASSSRKKPLLILPRGLGTHFCCINRCGGYSSSYVEIYGNIIEPDLLNIWLFCNSSLLWLLREVTGRSNLGGGMLKAEATDLRSIPICYDFKEIDKIANLFHQLTNYPISTNLVETLDDPYHKAIDEIVLSALDLKDEKDYINQQLIKMVSYRMKKSKNK
ncbi:MAG: N-6 DNA methylase [Bacteroidales bacterium]|nr:N-6 DNA methylase [Bacteroidales bacterium]